MGAHIRRGMMLDPGLTVLALRGLHDQHGHYPFLDRFTRRGRRGRRAARVVEVPQPSCWRRAVQWVRRSMAAPGPVGSPPPR